MPANDKYFECVNKSSDTKTTYQHDYGDFQAGNVAGLRYGMYLLSQRKCSYCGGQIVVGNNRNHVASKIKKIKET